MAGRRCSSPTSCVHLAVAFVAWAALLSSAALQPGWISAVNAVIGGWDPAAVHDVVSTVVVIASLAIANIVGGGAVRGDPRPPGRAERGRDPLGRPGRAVRRRPRRRTRSPRSAEADRSRRWSVRIGPLDARIEAEPDPPRPRPRRPRSPRGTLAPRAQTARVGATIGILERILIVVFVLTGTEAAIGFVVAAKTLARFRLLDDRDFAEYYLLGTLASVAVAIVTALVGRAALVALLA